MAFKLLAQISEFHFNVVLRVELCIILPDYIIEAGATFSGETDWSNKSKQRCLDFGERTVLTTNVCEIPFANRSIYGLLLLKPPNIMELTTFICDSM